MSRIIRPDTKVIVFDPTSGTHVEAATTDVEEMERRRIVAEKESTTKKKRIKKTK